MEHELERRCGGGHCRQSKCQGRAEPGFHGEVKESQGDWSQREKVYVEGDGGGEISKGGLSQVFDTLQALVFVLKSVRNIWKDFSQLEW